MMAAMHATLSPAPAPNLRRWHRGFLAALAGIALFAGGCAELPAQVERPASKAWATPESTSLGTLTQGLRQNAGSGNASGFLLLSGPQDAYAARLALIASAQKTLDLTLRELNRLKDDIQDEEIERVQVGLKSSLIKQEESTTSRAGTLASDWYYLGRVRPFEEIQAAINGLSARTVMDHLHRLPPGDFTIVTLGDNPLTIPT